ncbi:unnamed protein product [Symbiodinium necroappetens]|uniref:Uncharacterized protein n=1 Tax=Symbiodinium necroappetens TaxID=1628268 RepID=A0A812ZYV7_9DINO|nr:unnamed protein product [Symbiodinium necroappetens]
MTIDTVSQEEPGFFNTYMPSGGGGNRGHPNGILRSVIPRHPSEVPEAKRAEDAINLLRIETSYVTHMRISTPEAVVSAAYHAPAGWKEMKESNPESPGKPLRSTLIHQSGQSHYR